MKRYIKQCSPIFSTSNKLCKIILYSKKEKQNKLIQQINSTLNHVQYINDNIGKIDNFLYIHIVDCPQKRKYIDHPYYINGGFTFINGNTIYVFRKDEWHKTVLHEIIHHVYHYKYKDVIWENKTISVNEAVVEFLATILETRFCNGDIQNEIKHNLINSQHILNIHLSNKSNVLAYIFAKQILLENHKNVLKNCKDDQWIYKYLQKHITLFKKITPPTTKPKYLTMLYHTYGKSNPKS